MIEIGAGALQNDNKQHQQQGMIVENENLLFNSREREVVLCPHRLKCVCLDTHTKSQYWKFEQATFNNNDEKKKVETL